MLATQPLVEPLALEALERNPESPVAILAGPEDGGDVWRLDVGCDGRLALEPGDEVRVLRCAFVQHLEGDLLAGLAVGGVNLAHPSTSDQSAHAVDAADGRSYQ